MLYRNKKKNDLNAGKYVGLGGKFEDGESPYDCVIREVFEESGLSIKSPEYRGLVTFVSNIYETEQMHLFVAKDFVGDVLPCNEGELRWVAKEEVCRLALWEGDKIFLRLLDSNSPFFCLKLVYEGDTLCAAVLNGEEIDVYEKN